MNAGIDVGQNKVRVKSFAEMKDFVAELIGQDADVMEQWEGKEWDTFVWGKKEEPSGVELDIKNEGQDCWKGCGENQDVGQCDWCGKDGMCCRMGWKSDGGCDGCLGGDTSHVCVKKPWYLQTIQCKIFNYISMKIRKDILAWPSRII